MSDPLVVRPDCLPPGWAVRVVDGFSVQGEDYFGNARAGVSSIAETNYESREIRLSREHVERFSTRQRDQLLLHEAAHAIIDEPRALTCADFDCVDVGRFIHAHACDCVFRTTGHCIHWRRVARRIGYVDAFMFAPCAEEMDPGAAARGRGCRP